MLVKETGIRSECGQRQQISEDGGHLGAERGFLALSLDDQTLVQCNRSINLGLDVLQIWTSLAKSAARTFPCTRRYLARAG